MLLGELSADILGRDGEVEAETLEGLEVIRANGDINAVRVAVAAQRDVLELLERLPEGLVVAIALDVVRLVAVVRDPGVDEGQGDCQRREDLHDGGCKLACDEVSFQTKSQRELHDE